MVEGVSWDVPVPAVVVEVVEASERPVEDGGQFGDQFVEELLVRVLGGVGAGEGDYPAPVAKCLVLERLRYPVGRKEGGCRVVETDGRFVFYVAGDEVVAAGEGLER